MTMPSLSRQQLDALAADSGCALPTVLSVLTGYPTRPVSRRRVEESVRRLGLQIQIPSPEAA